MKLVELFRIVENGFVITQTSAAYDIDYNGETYVAYPLGRSEAEDKSDMERANVDLDMDIANPLAQRYLTQPVDRVVSLTIFRKEDDESPYVYWKGRLANNKPGKARFVMSFESIFTSMRRPGLRARVQRPCRHTHYGRGCRLNMEDFRLDTTIVTAVGKVIVVASVGGAPDDTFRAGIIKAPDGTMRYIAKQVGTTLTLSRPFEVLNEAAAAGKGYGNAYGEYYGGYASVAIYPGCAHDEPACISFGNLPNYGGFKRLPTKNPVGGSSIM